MQIGAYVLFMKAQVPTGFPEDQYNNSPANTALTNYILKTYFTPCFTVYGPEYSLCLCEDRKSVCFDTGKILFKNYEVFLQSEYVNVVSVAIQSHGDITELEDMKNEIMRNLDSSGAFIYLNV